VRLDASGGLEWPHAWSTTGPLDVESDAKRWNFVGNLSFGTPVLGGGAGYTRSQESSTSWTRAEGEPRLTMHSPELVREAYSFFTGWRPAGLPSVDVRLSRSNEWDSLHQIRDSTTDTALLNLAYAPFRQVALNYSVSATDSNDRLHSTEAINLAQAFQGTYRETILERTAAYLSYTLSSNIVDTRVHGSGGIVQTQRFPIAGLSLIETFADSPLRDTLKPNAGLVDGVTNASAGIDLGTDPSLRGDTALRDMGLQFADPLKSVNVLYLWVNCSSTTTTTASCPQPLPSNVVNALLRQLQVFWSDDNLTWTRLVPGTVTFEEFQPRFRIPIPETTKRYLKVVMGGITLSDTTDARFASIVVTELQAFLEVDAATVKGTHSTLTNAVTGSATTRINKELAHDLSFALTKEQGTPPTWLLTNGLSYARRLTPVLASSARVARTDTGGPSGHRGLLQYGASLAADPIPAFASSVGYSGTVEDSKSGIRFTNGLTGFARADWYTGVSSTANAAFSVTYDEVHRTSQNASGSASFSMQPHPALALNGSYALSWTSISGGGTEARTTQAQQATGTATFNPIPALVLSGQGTWLAATDRPATTLWSWSAVLSPFRGGTLLLGANHTETYETTSQSTTRSTGASAQWKIRAGWSLDLGYSDADARSPAGRTTVRSLSGRFVFTI
jgi:hypothetical protein